MGKLNLRVLIEAVDRATAPVRRVARALRVTLPNAARVGGAALRRLGGLAVQAVRAISLLAGVSFGALSFGALRTGMAFETFLAQLETAEGTAGRARQAMSWIDRFAKKTPYEIDQVTEAYIAMRNYGIDPTAGALESVGNASSAMNKSVMQGVEALADAQTGEFERLKEYGIRARAESGHVRFTYMQDGKEITVQSAKNAAAIQGAILGIFDSRFAGAMDRQSQTMKGMWSNLMDMLTSFQRQIADAGLFDFVKAELGALLTQVNAAAANGDMAKWAKQISDSLVELLKSVKALVTEVDWVGFTKGVIDAANGFARFMDWIGGLEGLITGGVAVAIGWLTTAMMGLGVTIAGALGLATAPVAAVIAAIGLIGLAGWFLYRNWESIWDALKRGWDGFVRFLRGVWRGIVGAFKAGVDLVWRSLPPWFRMILRGSAFAVKIATDAVSRIAPGSAGREAPAVGPNRRPPPNGTVEILVRQDGQVVPRVIRGDGVAVRRMSAARGGYGR